MASLCLRVSVARGLRNMRGGSFRTRRSTVYRAALVVVGLVAAGGWIDAA